MRRLLAIAVMGAAAVLPVTIEAQLRAAPGIRVAPGQMRAVRPFARPMTAPAFRGGFAGTRLRFAPPGRFVVPRPGIPRPGIHGGFAPPRFGSRHLVGLGNLGFFFNQCLSIFNPFFCDNFFFGNFFFRRFPVFSPFFSAPVVYSYPAFYPQTQVYAASGEQQNELAEEVRELGQEIQQLREEQISRQALAERRAPAPQSRTEEKVAPMTLIFRNGQREEVQNYAVVGKTLWIFTEQRARKLPLSELDLEATRKVNEERRGVEFLPRRPQP
jgi:ribosomal 50S subunit-associated protein YjgA (DUF615 family)